MTQEHYLSVEEVAVRLNVAKTTVGKYVRQGTLKAVKNPVNGHFIGFREADIQAFITGHPVEDKKGEKQLDGGEQPNGENKEVAVAKVQTTLRKELAEQAEQQNKESEAKIKMQLRQKGYDSIEKGLADVEAKKKEAIDLLQAANGEQATVRAELEELAKAKQKLANDQSVVKIREEAVNQRYKDIMIIEGKQKEFVTKYSDWKKSLQDLVVYHRDNIVPCAKAIKAIDTTIYRWIEILDSNTHYNWEALHNWLGEEMRILDAYVDHIPDSVSGLGAEKKEEQGEKKEVESKEDNDL